MPKKHPKTHELVRARLSPEALAAGRKLYLASSLRELRADVRRRRYSAMVEEKSGTVSVKIEHGKDGPNWLCSADGRNDPNCRHVAALLIGIREREASEPIGPRLNAPGGARKESMVEHLLENAEREHLIEAFKLCLKTYPELQGDLVFTILENIESDGALYDEIVALMEDPGASENYVLPREGFDAYRLLDEINYLYEQEKFKHCFLLSRAVLVRFLEKLDGGRRLLDAEIDLVIASSGMLADLTVPPVPEQFAQQVHDLGLKLLLRYPKLEPQIQSSLIALIDEQALDNSDLVDLEQRLRRRWERARKNADAAAQREEAERLAMPLALFYARTQEFDKLQALFDRYLQNPLLRAPALAEMLHHELHELVLKYVLDALVVPGSEVGRDDPEDMARCGMYNDLIIMLADAMPTVEPRRDLLRQAFLSIGHRIYSLLTDYLETFAEEERGPVLENLADELAVRAADGIYASVAAYYVVLCEQEDFETAYEVLQNFGPVDPILLLDYLPGLLALHPGTLFEPAMEAVIELFPIVGDEPMRDLIRQSIERLWDIDEAGVRNALDSHYTDIIDDELADYIDILLGEFEPGDLLD